MRRLVGLGQVLSRARGTQQKFASGKPCQFIGIALQSRPYIIRRSLHIKTGNDPILENLLRHHDSPVPSIRRSSISCKLRAPVGNFLNNTVGNWTARAASINRSRPGVALMDRQSKNNLNRKALSTTGPFRTSEHSPDTLP